ncbi:MAG: ABC transporter ATP-binding protein [Candidatus Thorarchaeota archaeon]|nr:ABC transporter ATP-binding protein [Candidatus Thorarchaeota archaeon]
MYAIELENISKTFPGGVEANKDITLRIEEGEVHGLLGENGAGKTTLMNVLYGLLSKDSGKIKIRGEEVDLESPHGAIARGVGMVHQHFKLIPPLTVVENVILGLEPTIAKFESFQSRFGQEAGLLMPMDIDRAAERIKEIALENGMKIDPFAKMQDLSVGLRQRVEILKTLYRNAEILILDEPTSVLTPQEVDDLFVTLDKFKEQGRTIILITHKLREPMALCDRITVLREGKLVGTVDKDDTSPKELAKMMVGRPVVFRIEKEEAHLGKEILRVENLKVKDTRGLIAVDGVNLSVREGEILGIAGVEGNGQTELVEAIAGIRKVDDGRVFVDGNEITNFDARKVRETGVCHIPEDRHRKGLVLDFTVRDNIALGRHYYEPFATGPNDSLLNMQQLSSLSSDLVNEYSIMVSSINAPTRTLSGGNQQKVIVARELAYKPKLVLAAQPTRGLDVGATEFIRNTLIDMRDKGAAILLISAELDEITNLAGRIAVIHEGKVVAKVKPEETTYEELGLLMAGHEERVKGV